MTQGSRLCGVGLEAPEFGLAPANESGGRGWFPADLSRFMFVDHSRRGRTPRTRRWVMCEIPLDLQRKLEQRWVARFARPAPSVPPQRPPRDKQHQQLASPAEGKEKTRRVEPTGLT